MTTTAAALKVHALRTELDAIEAKVVSEARDLHAEAGPGQRHPDQPHGRLLRCSVVPEGRPRWNGERWTREHPERPLSRVAEEKSSSKLVSCVL
jgi:hypothetical protein